MTKAAQAKSWTLHEWADGSNRSAADENGTDTGTYGRFALISGETWRAYILQNRAADPVYVKRVA